MKNVILLTIDSFTAEALKDEKYGDTAMPFFKSLIKKSVYAENYYSEGPHTEMGLQAMMTGMDTLDNSASLRRFVYADNTMYDSFNRAGYRLAMVNYPSNFFPKRFQGIMEEYYTEGDCFVETIFWRLKEYVDLYNSRKIKEQDYIDLIGCFDDSFNSYLNFLDTERHGEKNYYLTKNRIRNVDLQTQFKLVNDEYKKYIVNKRAYVEEVLKNNGELADILLEDNNDPQDEEKLLYSKLEQLYNNNLAFFKKMEKKQKIAALSDSRTSFSKLFTSFINYLKKENHEYIGTMSARYKQYKEFILFNGKRAHLDSSSLKTQLSFISDLLYENKKSDKPYFIYLHAISQHTPTQWLSVDQPLDVMQRELDEAQKLINKTKHYKGHYTYRLGLKYVDDCLKKFFVDLENKDILGDSIVVITADHGSSCCMNPIREEMGFNNCHSELYHIPLLIFDKDYKPQILRGYYTHRDLLATLLDITGIKDDCFTRGHSILDENYNPLIALSERTPSGAPTLMHKDAIYTARNKNYLIEYRCSVFKDFNDGRLTDVYDLVKDRDELKNLVGKIENEKIQDLLDYIKNRHIQLSDNYKNWLKTDMWNKE